MSIYTPRSVIDQLLHPLTRDLKNKQVCTKIEFFGYKISIAMDSSHGDGDLFRSDIRIYKDDKDISNEFFAEGSNMLYGDAQTLFRIMSTIQKKQ